MNVLVVPEDFRKDQYILKPIIRSLFAHIGCANAKVEVCRDPLLGGVSEALKWEIVRQILERYRWQVDMFLLCVDRDGSEGRSRSLRGLETQAREMLGAGRFFFGENAWQELEVWVLAGHTLPKDWRWNDIRADHNPKALPRGYSRLGESCESGSRRLKVANGGDRADSAERLPL